MSSGPSTPASSTSPPSSPSSTTLVVAWNVTTERSLCGMQLARETGHLLAWDENGTLSFFDPQGRATASWRCPRPLHAAACSDDGQTAAAQARDGTLYWLDGRLRTKREHPAVPGPLALALAPHGDYAVVTSTLGPPRLFDTSGRPAGMLNTSQPLAFIQFLPEQPYLVAAAEQGLVASYHFDGRARWEDTFLAPVGGIAATGNGSILLAACFGSGVQRYSGRGDVEGTYRLAGHPARITSTYGPEMFAIATTEGQLNVLDYAGHIIWNGVIKEQALAIAFDALGRCLYVGYPRGEIVCLHWAEPSGQQESAAAPSPRGASSSAAPSRPRHTSDFQPDGTCPLPYSESEVRAAVLAVHDRPLRLAVFLSSLLEIYEVRPLEQGGASIGRLHQSEKITGLGRILCVDPGTVVAVTDSRALVYSVRANTSQLLQHHFGQLTNVAVAPLRRALVVVEERDRLSRISLDGELFWTVPLEDAVQDLAVGPKGVTALTTDGGQLWFVSETGRIFHRWQAPRPEPMLLVAGADRFFTLSRDEQIVRAHALDGTQLWAALIPDDAWRLQRAGNFVIATTPDGRPFAVDANARVHPGPADLGAESKPCPRPDGGIDLLVQEPEHVVLRDWQGNVQWRLKSTQAQPGPVAAGSAGILVARGRALHWFAHAPLAE